MYMNSNNNMTKQYKVVLIGASGVGKSSIMTRIVKNRFHEYCEPTLGASFYNLKRENCEIQIWDTAGQERYRSLLPMYLRNCKAIILVYDLTNAKNTDFYFWAKYINDTYCNMEDKPLLYLVGNKIDLLPELNPDSLDSELKKKEIQKNAKINIPILGHEFTSAKNGHNVHKLFDHLESELNENIKINEEKETKDVIMVVENEEKGYISRYMGNWCSYF